jgi:hypothetical protein
VSSTREVHGCLSIAGGRPAGQPGAATRLGVPAAGPGDARGFPQLIFLFDWSLEVRCSSSDSNGMGKAVEPQSGAHHRDGGQASVPNWRAAPIENMKVDKS